MVRTTALAFVLALAGCQADTTEATTPSVQSVRDAAPDLGASRTGGQPTVVAMQGTWRSQDDPLSVIRIDGDQIVNVYDGETLTAETVRAVRSCDDLTDDPSSVYFVVEGGEPAPLCYEMDGVDEQTLAYFYSARGNRLSYERISE